MKEFKNIKNIIFDCDGVLYKDLDAVFGQVSKRMSEYISKKLLDLCYMNYPMLYKKKECLLHK